MTSTFSWQLRPPPTSTLFPYTTLFRSLVQSSVGTFVGTTCIHGVSWSVRRIEKSQYLRDRKSTRLNSSHPSISYAVFCLKKKTPAPGQGQRHVRHASSQSVLR